MVDGSGTVGPDAIIAGSSPGTSEIKRVTTCAGWAATARWPPLIAESCFRKIFICEMDAPERKSARCTACLSARLTPWAGAAKSADPPPEMRNSARSSAPKPCASSSRRTAVASLAASGTGWAVSTTSIPCKGRLAPWGTAISPSHGPHAASTACAIRAVAFPAPITTTRPFGR